MFYTSITSIYQLALGGKFSGWTLWHQTPRSAYSVNLCGPDPQTFDGGYHPDRFAFRSAGAVTGPCARRSLRSMEDSGTRNGPPGIRIRYMFGKGMIGNARYSSLLSIGRRSLELDDCRLFFSFECEGNRNTLTSQFIATISSCHYYNSNDDNQV